MNKDLHDGKQIAWIHFGEDEVICLPGEIITAEYIFHGEYDIWWAVKRDSEGAEISRWNIAKSDGFGWAKPIPPQGEQK